MYEIREKCQDYAVVYWLRLGANLRNFDRITPVRNPKR